MFIFYKPILKEKAEKQEIIYFLLFSCKKPILYTIFYNFAVRYYVTL